MTKQYEHIWDDPEFWPLVGQFDNSHGEGGDCSGYRFEVIEGPTRRRKDEILYEVGQYLKKEDAELWEKGRKPHTEAERLILAYSLGQRNGFERGKAHAEFTARFRKFYDLSEEDPIP